PTRSGRCVSASRWSRPPRRCNACAPDRHGCVWYWMPPPSGTADSAAHRPFPPRSESPTTRRTSMPEGSPPTRTMIEPARTTVHVQRRTMIVLVLMQVVGTVGVGVAPSIGVLLAGEVTDSEAWAGLARTSSTLGAALLGLPLGSLAARAGRRTALATGWWTGAAGSALLVAAAQGDLIVALFFGLLLIGAGSAVSLQARFAATDLTTPVPDGRSRAPIARAGTLGSVLGPNLGVPGRLLGPSTGLNVYAGAFLIAAVCLALAGVIVFLCLRPDPLLHLHRAMPTAAVTTQRRSGRM